MVRTTRPIHWTLVQHLHVESVSSVETRGIRVQRNRAAPFWSWHTPPEAEAVQVSDVARRLRAQHAHRCADEARARCIAYVVDDIVCAMTDIDIGTVVATLLTVYALGIGGFLISENRAPQATLAWMLAFILAPGLGVLIYLLFGRDGKAFSKQRKLLKQDLASSARPVLSPILSRQDAGRPTRARQPVPPAADEAPAAQLLLRLDHAEPRRDPTGRGGVLYQHDQGP